MNILQWNIRGFSSNYIDLQLLISQWSPVAICLQETKLPLQSGKAIRGYSFIESPYDYGNQSSNTAIIIRDDIPFRNFNFLSNIRFTAIKIFIKKWYTLCSVYLPPAAPIMILL